MSQGNAVRKSTSWMHMEGPRDMLDFLSWPGKCPLHVPVLKNEHGSALSTPEVSSKGTFLARTNSCLHIAQSNLTQSRLERRGAGDTLPGTIMEVEFTTCLYSDNGNARGHLSLPLLFQGDLQSDRRTKTWLFLAGALFPDVSNHWQSGSNHGCVSRD